jgi:hypothetical protein
MPWVIRDVVDDINKAVTKRWRHLDPLLPEPGGHPALTTRPLQTSKRTNVPQVLISGGRSRLAALEGG